MAARERMSLGERLAFAGGDIYLGGGGAVAGVLGWFFLTDIIGLQPVLAGIAVGIGPIVDMVYRPLVAQLLDNVRTPWGRRRPFLVGGAVFIPLLAALTWAPIGSWPEQGAKFAYTVMCGVLGTLIGTVIGASYDALSTEITTDDGERNSANLIRLAFSTISGAVGTLLVTQLASEFKAGRVSFGVLYWTLVAGFGGVYALGVLLVGLLVHERAPVRAERTRFTWRAYAEPFRIPAFRALMALYLLQALAMDAVKRLLLAHTVHVAHINATLFLAIVVVVSLLGFFVVNRLVRTVSKGRIYTALLPLAVVGVVALAVWPSHWPTWPVYVFALLFAVGFCGAQMMPWVMFPDVVDAGELASGRRNSATFSAVLLLCRAVAATTMGFTIGLLLQLGGYRSAVGSETVEQPASAILTIRALLIVFVAVLLGAAWFVGRRYPLTRAKVDALQADLAAARAER